MDYQEVYMDFSDVDQAYYIVHCVGADFGTYVPDEKPLNKDFDVRRAFKALRPDYERFYAERLLEEDVLGDCIIIGNVINLVTKRKSKRMTSYDSLHEALVRMKYICNRDGITSVAFSENEFGADELDWDWVKNMIQEVFCETDMRILVCERGNDYFVRRWMKVW